MYAQLEEAGLINGTEEWEEMQENKFRKMIEREGEADAEREADGQALLSGRFL